MSFQLRALRTIERGEQLFITYTSTLQSRAQRQQELLSKYAFTCACSSCSLPKKESVRSDIRRSLLLTAHRNPLSVQDDYIIKTWAADPSLSDDHIIKHSQKIVDLMEEEGVCEESLWPPHYTRLCKAYCALGDRDSAKTWAKKSAIMATAFTGNDGGWSKVVDAPEHTEWWGLRKKTMK